jgi:lipopolysaccharide/colanic/teichoic acid biosynthesis glycosyltransferase
VKRAFDLTVAFLALVITSPIVIAAAIAVKLESPGPAFYSGPRVGLKGEPFRIHKLRTMRMGADGMGPAVTAAGDSRITSVGRLLRRTKADELPQLVNVLKGEMSLVGPRPEHPDYVRHYTAEQRLGLSVRPGMTGPTALAYIDEEQILGGGDAETIYLKEVMPRKLALDLDYVRTATFGGDLRILLKTAALLLRRPFASRRPDQQP